MHAEGWIGIALTVAALALAGPAGCDDDDDEEGGGATTTTTTVVVTNQVDGTVVTNVVVVTNAPAADVPPPAEEEAPPPAGDEAPPAAGVTIAGIWTGNFSTDAGRGQLQVQVNQAGSTLAGQFRLNTGGADQVGNATGIVIDGDHVVLMLDVTANDRWMELNGEIHAAATAYSGTLTGTYGQGQFELHK